MLLHSVIIAIIAFIAMVYFLKQDANLAENRSLLIGSVSLIYMILFGHKLPTSINKI